MVLALRHGYLYMQVCGSVDNCSAFAHVPLWNARGSLEGTKDMYGIGEGLSQYRVGIIPDLAVILLHLR